MVYYIERVSDATTFQKDRQYEFPAASYLIPISMWRQ
jgi:hypothetical protein